MVNLILPSLVCLLAPLVYLSFRIKGQVEIPLPETDVREAITSRQKSIVFFSGLIILIMVPVFKTVTHLPPFMGMLIGLGILWLITEMLHIRRKENEKYDLSVGGALRRIDTPTILFFLGILITISALGTAGILTKLADQLSSAMPNESSMVLSIGLLSAIIDNVPLVAAAQGMYDLTRYPTDHYFWEFLAYCTGTGGSVLIIGSAAGVAVMGIEKISFFWYLKNISLLALLGYFAGAAVYIVFN